MRQLDLRPPPLLFNRPVSPTKITTPRDVSGVRFDSGRDNIQGFGYFNEERLRSG